MLLLSPLEKCVCSPSFYTNFSPPQNGMLYAKFGEWPCKILKIRLYIVIPLVKYGMILHLNKFESPFPSPTMFCSEFTGSWNWSKGSGDGKVEKLADRRATSNRQVIRKPHQLRWSNIVQSKKAQKNYTYWLETTKYWGKWSFFQKWFQDRRIWRAPPLKKMGGFFW